jgi:hypothetical protein
MRCDEERSTLLEELTMKLMLPLTLTALLFAGQAMADCAAPATDTSIPNGAKATKDEMIAAQRALKALNAVVETYGSCLKTQQDAEIAAGGDKLTDDQKQKIAGKYAEKTNAEVDKLQKLADKFNIELRAFKAKNPA